MHPKVNRNTGEPHGHKSEIERRINQQVKKDLKEFDKTGYPEQY
jgi:hypothetical protein